MNFSVLISKVYNKFWVVHWCVSVLTAMMTIVLYPRLPQEVPTHFGFGSADNPGSKLEIFVLPVILIVFGLISSRKLIDQQYADLTIQNTLSKSLMLVLMVVVWCGVVLALYTYYQLAW
ncbi:DUF1648 domain-containing protein [Lentilactobacillus otakiensis]|uniref:DUF1648 domain-containing protein n=1 Tax=Lentilactobacillus otakiensis DSM 19908 = JCM 15040 TaxID=1423780 RepID=S4NUD0_9LACO|nr:DUF1648 domain-containing protein [Lentilactobacillus otakiensis]KRL09953.1 hypothetical protein FD05_GL000941 [Lentilactobacillus otakiensis DSM 19908 = JCM 15040]MBZ3776275.1 DUF1648 domain-containing protein [Lentilactobacillus otakiensis]MDV3517301.1 DUF1648 domain-containing protein [Lentilactobacillus otakiensis]GAD17568.1 conserved hypothetical protein [Lentilactobacillus otakiensis DSM 19908 = JCM 15040]